MTTILNRWRIYCTTESLYVYTWLDSTNPTPTTCPNNNGHTINGALTTVIETVNQIAASNSISTINISKI